MPNQFALTWDALGTHFYETGTDRGVLYPCNDAGEYQDGVAWNGLTGVNDNPEGGDATDLWGDNIKYASIRAAEKAGGTIEAYTYPDEFMACDGSAELSTGIYLGQQGRNAFGFSYRSMIGNDVSDDLGYKIHIYYGCTCSPSSKDYATINDSPDAIQFSWDFECNPVAVTGHKPCASLVIDSRKVPAAKLTLIEEKLYGTASSDPELPTPDQILTLIA